MKAAVLVFGILSLFSFVLYFYSANHAPYTYIDVIFWGPLCSFIGIVISIITRKTRKIHPALWISGIISCMLGYLAPSVVPCPPMNLGLLVACLVILMGLLESIQHRKAILWMSRTQKNLISIFHNYASWYCFCAC